MTPTRPLRLVIWLPLAAAVLAAVLLTAVGGCADDPEPPTWDNPFDPRNPAADDPLGLTATLDGDRVILAWTQLEGFGIETYEVEKSLDALNYTVVGDTAAGTGAMTFVVTDVTPTATNYFRVRAIGPDGDEPRMSQVTPAGIATGPRLTVQGPVPVLSRHVDLVATATRGDSVQLARSALFGTWQGAPLQDGTAGFPGVDLGTAESADTTFSLYARTVTTVGPDAPPSYSPITSLELPVGLSPAIALAGGGDRIASPLVDVALADSAAGVTRARFATTPEDLPEAAWVDAAPVLRGVPVQDTLQPQTLYAELETGFGYTVTTSLALTADDLAAADFQLDLPGNRISATGELTLLHDAAATEMRVSQDPGFTGAPWVAYADTSTYVLQGEPGFFQVYTQYRNHWAQSPIRSDWVILSGAELDVQFTTPTDGQVVRGGTALEVTGTASTFDADYEITAVRVHLGDGWIPASGTQNWEALWEVPRLGEDTAWSLGAEVTAANADSSDIRTGVAWIEVTVSQLTVAITEPVAEAELPRGRAATISGTATPYLAGAPLDSVVVTAAGARLPAAGDLQAWSVTWNVPADGTTPLPTDLEAVAYAGDDSVTARVPVILVAPPDGR